MSLQRWISLSAVLLLSGCAGGGGLLPGGNGSAEPARPTSDSTPNTPSPQPSTARVSDSTAPLSTVDPVIRAKFDRAVLLQQTGDQTGAEAELLRFIAEYPSFAAPWVNLAMIQIAQGRADEARASLDSSFAVDQDYAPAWNQLGILHRKNGNFSEAEAAYLNAVTVSPDYALAHLNLGILNDLYLGRLEAALSAYEAYQALQSEADPQVARWIADLSRRTGR